MKTTFDWLALIVTTSCIAVLLVIPGGAMGESINVDEIIFEQGGSNDPALDDLNPQVSMSFDSATKLLTVVLSNESSYAGSPDAGHLLTGLGFNLPTGVSIEDIPGAGRDSTVQLTAGSVIIDPVSDPNGTSGILLTQDDWGYANGVKGGHFVTAARLSTNTVLSSMKPDAEVTFAGNSAKKLETFDYGLQGLDPTPGHPQKSSIRNSVTFSLYLDGSPATDWDGLLSYINGNAVVVSYGSPRCSSQPVPEPGVFTACLVLFAALTVFRSRRIKYRSE